MLSGGNVGRWRYIGKDLSCFYAYVRIFMYVCLLPGHWCHDSAAPEWPVVPR